MRTKAGRYTLDDRVLDGPGWSYWCGTDGLLRRQVGLLVLDHGHPRTDEVVAAARASAVVEDPRIQRVLDVLEDDEGTCLVIEWTSGTTLEDLLAEGPLADVESWRVVLEVARAMSSAQAAGLHHGALAPRWVLRGDGGRVRVLGLCVAAALAGGDEEPELDPRCDAVGLGELLYAALTARWPGDPAASALPAPPTQGGRAVRPSRVRAGVPPGLDDIASRALGLTTRGAVPAGPPDVVAALELAGTRMHHFDAGEPVDLDPEVLAALVDTGYVERVSAELADRPGAAQAAGVPPRNRWVGWVVGAVVAGLVAGGLWLVGRPDTTTGSPPRPSPTGSPSNSTASSAEPTGAAVPIVSVRDFDPRPAGNGSENPDQVRLAWDGNPATAWHTVTYFKRADLGGLKPGVGLLVDLGSTQTVGAVRLGLVGHGTSVELRVATLPGGTEADDFIAVAHADDAGELVTLRPVIPQKVRFLLIWLTRLPVAADGVDYSGGISEIEVYRS